MAVEFAMPNWNEVASIGERIIEAQAAEGVAWRLYTENRTGELLLQWRVARETVNRLVIKRLL